MSTVVSVRKHGQVVVAWDTMNTIAGTISHGGVATKAFSVGDSIVATTGFAVYQTLLPHYISELRDEPDLGNEARVLEFFLEFWRALHKRYHFVNDASDTERPSPFADLDAEFMVANRHGIFRVKEILSILRFEQYCAIGSGAPQAEGALAVLYGDCRNAADIARRSVEVACAFDSGSGGEIALASARGEGEEKAGEEKASGRIA